MRAKKPQRDAVTVGDRLDGLIKARDKGSVLAASRRTGLPQRTLAHIVKGDTANPRRDVLLRIAETYGVRLEWLLAGKGAQMDEPATTGIPDAAAKATDAWRLALRELRLAPSVHLLLERLPFATQSAASLLLAPKKRHVLPDAIYRAMVTETSAWLLWLTTLRETLGDDALRQRLLEHQPSLEEGFRDQPVWFEPHTSNA